MTFDIEAWHQSRTWLHIKRLTWEREISCFSALPRPHASCRIFSRLMIQGGEDHRMPYLYRSCSDKAMLLVSLLRKEACNLRHSMHLRHPVSWWSAWLLEKRHDIWKETSHLKRDMTTGKRHDIWLERHDIWKERHDIWKERHHIKHRMTSCKETSCDLIRQSRIRDVAEDP